MTESETSRDVGLLLRFALDHTLVPARHDTYRRLLDRYHGDPELRAAFDHTTAGLGLRVISSDRSTGVVLNAEVDSPMAVKDVSHWLRIGGAADRMVYGVALGGVAAWCYPTARSVRESGTRRVSAVDVDRLIREHAAAVESGEIALDADMGPAWEEYAKRKQVASTKSGQLKRDCTVYLCNEVLEMLAAFGLLIPDKTVPPPRPDLRVWRSTDRFRAHVAVGGGPLAWQTIVGSEITPGTDSGGG